MLCNGECKKVWRKHRDHATHFATHWQSGRFPGAPRAPQEGYRSKQSIFLNQKDAPLQIRNKINQKTHPGNTIQIFPTLVFGWFN